MELFDPPPSGRRRPAGYIPLFDEAALADEPAAQINVTPEMRDSVLSELGAVAGGTLSRVGDALSAPGDYLRGFLVGKTGERVTGRDLLREAGLVGEEDNWGNFTAGLVADVATDPLSWITGPAKSVTAAGKALQKAGLADALPSAMTRKAISTGAVARKELPGVAKRTLEALEKTGRNISELDPAVVGRPLYGTRTSMRAGTLDDAIRYAGDEKAQAAAEKALLGVLGPDELARLRNQPLAKSFGLATPLGETFAAGDLLGKGFGDAYADILDTAGQAYRWSPVGRGMAAAFDQRVGGKLDPEVQLTNIANFEAKQKAGGIATAAHTYHIAKLQQEHPDVFTEQGNRHLGRYLEGPNVRKQEDIDFVESRPALKEYADWWVNNRQDYLAESRRMGLSSAELTDKYGIDYLPRRAEAILEMEARRNRKLGEVLNTFTGDMLRRTDAMQLPGGRDTIIDLSRDKMVSGPKRTLKTDEQATQYLLDKLTPMIPAGGPALARKDVEHLARVLNKLPDEVTQKSPLFGQHPTEMIGSYMRNRSESMATAGTLEDSLATFARDMPYNRVDTAASGGRHISMQEALNRLGLKSYDEDVVDAASDGGAGWQMRKRIAAMRGGVDPDSIKLSEISVPEAHVDRLLRARDAFETGEASQSLLNGLDHITQAWKGSILTWPARATRDLYSGAISNWLEGALDPDAVRAARALMQEGPQSPRFMQFLASITRYAGDDGVAQFYADVAGTGLIGNQTIFEHGGSVVGKGALGMLPGTTPVTMRSILSELAPQADRSWGQFARDFRTWRSSLKPLQETMNPIMRAGEQMNSLTDGINRFSGYLSLMKQGYDPSAATKAMQRAHVNYASLSDTERLVLKRLFPWYSFQSRIFREVLRQLSERPGGRYGQLIQATEAVQDESNDTYVPPGMRAQFSVPIPEEWGGVPAPGVQLSINDFDAPGFDQINMFETPGTPSGAIAGTARQFAMQLHPLLRTTVELGAGKDLFTDRPIGESTSTLDALARSITGNRDIDIPAIIEKPIEMAPFVGRPLYALRTLLDDAGGEPLSTRVPRTLLNATSGLKVRKTTAEDVRRAAARDAEASIDPYTREYKMEYIPEAMVPHVPQWALERQAVARALTRENREARKPAKKSRKKKRDTNTGALELFE
jgi:hypothetical protein